MRKSELKTKPRKVRPSDVPGKVESWVLEDGVWRSDRLKDGPKPRPRKAISPASPAQRGKAAFCIVTNVDEFEAAVDPAHLWARGRGGCNDPLCVVGLERSVHTAFDDGDFDLLPYLVGKHVPELCHALEHADGNLLALLQRLTGHRWRPE